MRVGSKAGSVKEMESYEWVFNVDMFDYSYVQKEGMMNLKRWDSIKCQLLL